MLIGEILPTTAFVTEWTSTSLLIFLFKLYVINEYFKISTLFMYEHWF